MNSAEHKAKAEEILREIEEVEESASAEGGVGSDRYGHFATERAAGLAKAQVHATLALYPDPVTVKYA